MTTEFTKKQDPFEDIQGTAAVPDITAGTKLLMAIIGKPKTGKSWFAATAPGYVLVYDFDGRYESLSTLPEEYKHKVKVKTLLDASQSQPTAFKALEADLNMLKYRKSEGKPIPDSFVLDSGTYLKKAVENEFFSQGGSTRSIKLSPTTALLRGKDWDTVNAVVGAFEYLISEYSQLGNLIVVFHEKPEKDKTASTAQLTKYTDQTTVDPQYLAVLLSRFNEVYRIQLDYEQNYVVTCKPSSEFLASTTLLIDKEERPSIQGLLNKHRANLAKQKAQID